MKSAVSLSDIYNGESHLLRLRLVVEGGEVTLVAAIKVKVLRGILAAIYSTAVRIKCDLSTVANVDLFSFSHLDNCIRM